MSRSRKRSVNCMKRGKRKPREIQKRVIKYINNKRSLYNGLLVVHGTGCGKTLAATIASQCYLDKYPDNKVIFIGPASLLNNFKDELHHYGIINMQKYKFYSFQKFYNLIKMGAHINCENTLLVIDEAHNLRNVKSKIAASIIKCAYKAHKKLLLTATPFINGPRDFVNIINMLHGKEITNSKQFPIGANITPQVAHYLETLLRGRIDYVPSCRGDSNFPTVSEKFINVPMSKAYRKVYDESIAGMRVGGYLIANPKKFLHGYRKAVNKAGIDKYYSEKLKKAIHLIKNSKGKIQKTIIFTNWISFGVTAISKYLKESKIKFGVFKGGLSATRKKEITSDFNNNKFPVLIITRAGGEGLDLKEVRNVIILDPVWHSSGIEQIIGRAVRYKSHSKLPKKDRHVNVMKMVLIYPKGDARTTGDQLLYKIIKRKKLIQNKIDDILKKSSLNLSKPEKIKIVKSKNPVLIKYKLKDLQNMTLTKLKQLCRSVGINKRTSGKSLSDFKKKDQAKLAKLFYKFIRS